MGKKYNFFFFITTPQTLNICFTLPPNQDVALKICDISCNKSIVVFVCLFAFLARVISDFIPLKNNNA